MVIVGKSIGHLDQMGLPDRAKRFCAVCMILNREHVIDEISLIVDSLKLRKWLKS
jgi:hypothetical protein